MTAHALRRTAAALGLLMLLAGPAGLSAEAEARSGNQRRAAQKKKIAKTKAKAQQRRAIRKNKTKKSGRASGALPRPKTVTSLLAGAVATTTAVPSPEASGSATGSNAPASETAPVAADKAPPSGRATTAAKKATTAAKKATTAGKKATTAAKKATTAPKKATAARATTAPKPAAASARALRASNARTVATAASALADAELTAAVREKKAKNLVTSRLRTKGGPKWEISTPALQFVGDKTNPVTGSGPITVIARQKVQPRGMWARIKHAFSTSSERKFLVLVDPEGAATIISSEANGFPYRAMKALTARVPVREVVSDIVKSKGVRNGLGMGVGAVGVAASTGPVGWVAAGALVYRGLQMMTEGVARRKVARRDAMETTVADIKSSMKKGETVTLNEAYRIYNRELVNQFDSGAVTGGTISPPSLAQFTEELSSFGL